MVNGYDNILLDVLKGKYNNTKENTIEHKEEYNSYGEMLAEKFKMDLFHVYKLENNYSNNCIYEKAFKEGKFEGYYGVLNCFNKLITDKNTELM